MTIQQINRGTAQSISFSTRDVVPAAEVWDLPERCRRTPRVDDVRTTHSINRKSNRPVSGSHTAKNGERDSFETRHDKRADVFLGAALGLALILGSAAGGVFAPGTSASQTEVSAKTVSAFVK